MAFSRQAMTSECVPPVPAPYEFTGKIVKVTIDLKEIMKADEAEERGRRAESAQKKAMSD